MQGHATFDHHGSRRAVVTHACSRLLGLKPWAADSMGPGFGILAIPCASALGTNILVSRIGLRSESGLSRNKTTSLDVPSTRIHELPTRWRLELLMHAKKT